MKKIEQDRTLLLAIVFACAAIARCAAESCWISSGIDVAATNPVPCYVSQLPSRFRLDTAIVGEAYHTDIEDILKCIRLCAERNEAFVLASHGIHHDAKHIHMKTEWLERILATASECGVQCLGFDELK